MYYPKMEISPIRYSVLIDTIFLEPHIFFMWMCMSLVLSRPENPRTGWEKGNTFPAAHCTQIKTNCYRISAGIVIEWFRSEHGPPCVLAWATFMTSRKHFSIALSASSTLCFVRSEWMYRHRKESIHYIMPSHVLSEVRAGSKLDLASAFDLILSFRSTSFIASWIFY